MPSHGVPLRPGALRAARETRGLMQVEVAALAGVPASTLAMWESGDREPRRASLLRLAQVLGVDAADVAMDLGDPNGLRERREAAGLTLAELAAAVGVVPMTISRWQRSGIPANTSPQLLERLEHALRGPRTSR